MIDYKDLMVGNWVYLSEKSKYPMRVQTVGEDYCYLNFDDNEGDPFDGIDKEMMPIEVTVGMLVNMGFETDISLIEFNKTVNNCLVGIIKDMSNSVGRDWYCRIDNKRAETIGGFDFQYLHELQNGIRLITKNDLDIKL